MSATSSQNVNFIPKVWSDHIQAYFDRKLALGSLALVDKTLMNEPGETANFPFWKQIGAAQEPAENEGLEVEAMVDDSFSVTVKEIGKAVGWKDKAIRKSAASRSDQESEAQRQLARVFAEKVDTDLMTLINTGGNYFEGYVATQSTERLNIRTLLDTKILSFGDKQEYANACIMHSLHYSDLMKDNTSGFLQANATDPMYGMPGFMGRLLGMAVFVLDTLPQQTSISGQKSWPVFVFKENPFGIYMAEDMKPEMDRDILHRETVVSATMWYGTLSLNQKVSTLDKRIGRIVWPTSVAG